jgi:TonB family protein
MQFTGPVELEEPVESPWVPDVRLRVELEPWRQTFVSNLKDLIRPPQLPPLELTSAPAPFWPDVFVKRPLPWRRFIESGLFHVLLIGLLLGASRFIGSAPQIAPAANFQRPEVVYYQPSEYLPPLDTRRAETAAPQKADPGLSRQPVISVPAEADNHSQTIVAAPSVKLKHDVALPNIVAWTDRPNMPIAPAPVIQAASIQRLNPRLDSSVVAPPPDAAHLARHRDSVSMQTSVVAPPPDLQDSSRTALQAPQASVIAPPPSMENVARRPVGDLNIGQSAVIAPAPQLPVGEQQTLAGSGAGRPGFAPQVVAPPPSISRSSSSSVGGGRVIALSLNPTVGAPPAPPAGNRRGSFAASPEGQAGASGNPGSASGNGSAASHGKGDGSGKEGGAGSKNGRSDLPAGLYVGKTADSNKTSAVAGDPGPKTSAPNPNAPATVQTPRVSSAPRPLQPESETKLSAAEREVFGTRKFYSMTLNMPNLNSAGGSWVIRFAELRANSADGGDLAAPSVRRKVDPAYPLQIMRENVAGTVILYAVIHANGSVGDVRVLSTVDSRLDQFASRAVAQWQFQPAMKNGSPVDVEAIFHIPFRAGRMGF